MHIHGYPVALGVISFALGAALWHFKWLHRAAMVAFGLAAALLVIGVVPWQEALAGLTGTGTGIVVLLVIAIFAAFGTAYEMRHKRQHARLYAHICAVISGTALVMIIANSARLLSEAARSPGKTGAALAQAVHGIRSGAAAHAQSPHQRLADLGLAAATIAVLGIVAKRRERRGGMAKGGPKAITSGRPAITPGRGGS